MLPKEDQFFAGEVCKCSFLIYSANLVILIKLPTTSYIFYTLKIKIPQLCFKETTVDS